MVQLDIETVHIKSVTTWDSGGGIELDVIELDGGPALVVSDDSIVVYPTASAFWDEADGGTTTSASTATILRPTGELLTLRA